MDSESEGAVLQTALPGALTESVTGALPDVRDRT